MLPSHARSAWPALTVQGERSNINAQRIHLQPTRPQHVRVTQDTRAVALHSVTSIARLAKPTTIVQEVKFKPTALSIPFHYQAATVVQIASVLQVFTNPNLPPILQRAQTALFAPRISTAPAEKRKNSLLFSLLATANEAASLFLILASLFLMLGLALTFLAYTWASSYSQRFRMPDEYGKHIRPEFNRWLHVRAWLLCGHCGRLQSLPSWQLLLGRSEKELRSGLKVHI